MHVPVRCSLAPPPPRPLVEGGQETPNKLQGASSGAADMKAQRPQFLEGSPQWAAWRLLGAVEQLLSGQL